MKPHVEKIITESSEEISSEVASTPAADYFFEVRNEKFARKLPEEQAL